MTIITLSNKKKIEIESKKIFQYEKKIDKNLSSYHKPLFLYNPLIQSVPVIL